MNSKKIISLLALSALMLSACGLTKKDDKSDSSETDTHESESESESSEEGGQKVEEKSYFTGQQGNLDGLFAFAASSASVDGEVVHLEQDASTGKTKMYVIDAGKATIETETVKYNITVKYGIVSGEGVNPLSLGNDYAAFQAQFLQASFRGAKDEKYLVGTGNALKLDIGFSYETFVLEDEAYERDTKTINLDEALAEEYISTADNHFNIEVIGSEAGKVYGEVNEDLTISLNENAVGEDLKFRVSVNGKTVEQDVFVNEGVNVYNSADLKAYFQNEAYTGEINVLRSFKAEYDENQLFEFEGETYSYDTNGENEELNWQGSPYFRYAHGDGNSLTINGNYMVLDGTSLEMHYEGKPANLEPVIGADAANAQAAPIQGVVCNPQEGIFRSYCSGGLQNVVINNYNIRGNSNRGDLEHPVTSSAGLIGYVAANTALEVNNCIFDYAVYGVAAYSQNATAEIKDSVISNTWGSSICTWRSHDIQVKNSLLTKAGSAAVWLLNNPKEGQQGNLLIDDDCVIDNYVDPTSAWFVAYNLTTIGSFADNIDNSVNAGAAQANAQFGDNTSKAHTIYNSNKLFNFVVLVQADTDIKEAQYMGRPYANVNIHSAASLIHPTRYGAGDYVDTTNDLYLLTAIFSGAGNSIVKALGVDDVTFAATFRQVLNGAAKANGLNVDSYTAGQIVQFITANPSYAMLLSGSFANALSRCLTARSGLGAKTYIEVDASFEVSGVSSVVGAVLEVKPVA